MDAAGKEWSVDRSWGGGVIYLFIDYCIELQIQ